MSDIQHLAHKGYNLEPNFRIYLSAVKKLKPVSVKNYLSDVRYFLNWFQSEEKIPYEALEQDFELMSTDCIQKYKAFLVSQAFPQRTINRRLSSLRALGAHLVSQGLIQSNPAKKVTNYDPHMISGHAEPKTIELPIGFMQSMRMSGKSDSQIEHITEDVREFLQVIHG